ncbi:MAG TPA: hypothetical protein VNZ58_14415 [Thermomicrobiales bacterium]|nr:hypothetical protein [Thermomicrobiales bacterium]
MQPNDPDTTDRDVPFEPVDRKAWEAPEEQTKTYGGPPKSGLSQTMMLGIAIVVLILIVLFVYLIM